jgi:hypothetical protein
MLRSFAAIGLLYCAKVKKRDSDTLPTATDAVLVSSALPIAGLRSEVTSTFSMRISDIYRVSDAANG